MANDRASLQAAALKLEYAKLHVTTKTVKSPDGVRIEIAITGGDAKTRKDAAESIGYGVRCVLPQARVVRK